MGRTLRVVLTRTVDGLGKAGTEHTVASAYAQRVLLPNGSAVVSSARARAQVAAEGERQEKDRLALEERAQTALKGISGRTVVVPAKASGAKLYGSVDATAIVGAAKSRLGVTLEPTWLKLSAPITTVGDHRVGLEVPGAPPSHLTVTVSAT